MSVINSTSHQAFVQTDASVESNKSNSVESNTVSSRLDKLSAIAGESDMKSPSSVNLAKEIAALVSNKEWQE